MKWLKVKLISQFFYEKSNLLMAALLSAVFVGYLLLVFTGKGAGFALAESEIQSLGTSFGFDQADVFSFFSDRTNEMIHAYRNFNQVWDTLFGLIYGLMYVAWVSVLFKPISQKVGILNLVPFAQVLFDWMENFALVLTANQYLADGTISSSSANLASVFSMVKWACSGLTYTVILVGIVLMVARMVANKKQLQ
jgi:hypothetical protein